MIVFCEDCGEKYVIEEKELKASSMILICNVCNDIIRIPAPVSINSNPGTKTKGRVGKR